MTIFCAHEPRGMGIDLAPLYEYAEAEGHDVKFVFSAGFNPGLHTAESMAVAETFAANFNFGEGDKEGDLLVVAGGDPLASIFCAIALTHEAIAAGAKTFRSLRYIRERDGKGARTIPKYIPIEILTGVR